MSRQFKPVAIYVTTSPAADFDHDGKAFQLEDYPVGTVLAVDKLGDLFKFNRGWGADSTWRIQPMFRDYWLFSIGREDIQQTDRTNKVSPVNRAILAASKRLVAGVDKFNLVV